MGRSVLGVLVSIPVGYAGTLLSHTAIELATALSAYLPGDALNKTRSSQSGDEGKPPVDRQAFAHDKTTAIGTTIQAGCPTPGRHPLTLSHRSAEISQLGPNDPRHTPLDGEGTRALQGLNNTEGRLLLRPIYWTAAPPQPPLHSWLPSPLFRIGGVPMPS